MVVVLVRDFLQLRDVHQAREIVKVEHRVVLAVLAEERDVLAEVHIPKVVGDEAPVAPLHALAEFRQNLLVVS